MQGKTKSDLEVLLAGYDDRITADHAAAENRAGRIHDFEAAFSELCAAIVRPAFEEFGRVLEAHGHHFRVIERERYIDLDGRIRRPAIELEIRPKSGGEHAFPRAACRAGELSKALLEAHLIGVAEEIFAAPSAGER